MGLSSFNIYFSFPRNIKGTVYNMTTSFLIKKNAK